MLRHKKLHGNVSTSGASTDALTSWVLEDSGSNQPAQPETNLQLPAGSSVLPADVSVTQSSLEVQNSRQPDDNAQQEAEVPARLQPHGVDPASGPSPSQDVGTALHEGFTGVDFGFDWTVASEDIFGLLRSEQSMEVNFALPMSQYSQNFSDAQTCLTNGSMDGHAPSGSVDASREAVQAMSKIIKDLPAKLIAELENNSVTSSFFDECMDLFFTRFLATFPLVHKPTFHARDCGPTLLLNMLALGSAFIVSKEATTKGESLWSLAHAVVATSWPSLMSQRWPGDNCDGVQLVQTAALGQIYSLLSGNYTLRMTSQVFHSLGFYWSRECGMYGSSTTRQSVVPWMTATSLEKTAAWTKWASSENQLRALLAHYILDGVIAQFSGNPTCARHAANALPIPASAAAFEATTADDWIKEMTESKHVGMPFHEFIFALFHGNEAIIGQPISEFAMRVVLESLQSMVLEEVEAGGNTIGIPSRYEISAAMLRLHRWQVTQSSNAAELLLRWHCIFLSMAVDTRALCDRLCSSCDMSAQLFRPRSGQVRHGNLDVRTWANTCDARRALLHAFAIRDIVQDLPFGHSQAIHIPFAIFMAATIQAAFMAMDVQVLAVPAVIDWEVVWLNGGATPALNTSSPNDISSNETQQFIDKAFAPENPRMLSRKMSLELHSLRMQLRGISFSWGISQQMDHIMDQWHRALRL